MSYVRVDKDKLIAFLAMLDSADDNPCRFCPCKDTDCSKGDSCAVLAYEELTRRTNKGVSDACD